MRTYCGQVVHMSTISTDERLTDRIFNLLREDIITCRLKPGESFNEAELAKRFKTSRTPIREACNRLSKEGLLISIPNKGYFVAPITIRDVLNLYQLRFIVETACAELAARVVGAEELMEVEALLKLEREKRERVTYKTLIAMNREFHVRLAKITKNERIVSLVDSLVLESARLDHLLMDVYPSEWTDHSEILRALKARDPLQAREAMGRHIQLTQERMSKLFSGERLMLSTLALSGVKTGSKR